MAAIARTSPKQFLGALIPNVKVLSSKIDELINKINNISTSDNTLLANSIGSSTSGYGVKATNPVVQDNTASAINATATATAAQVATGLITSTSAAATAITFPTAASLLAALGTTTQSYFDLVVDNVSGANTVTMTPSASITAATAVVTGGATLTVASGAAGIFRIYFTSATAAKVYRIG